MPAFFRLLAQHYPKGPEGQGRLALHARNELGRIPPLHERGRPKDLRPLARKAFGWPPEWEEQYRKAREESQGSPTPADRPPARGSGPTPGKADTRWPPGPLLSTRPRSVARRRRRTGLQE